MGKKELNNEVQQIEGGYLIIARKIQDSLAYSKGLEYIGLITELIRRANHAPRYTQGMICQRGQFITSGPKLSEALNISRSKLNRMLSLLKKEEFLTLKADSQRTIITICNYDRYQNPANYKRTTNGQQKDSKRTLTRSKELKNTYIRDFPLIEKLGEKEQKLFIEWLIVSENKHGDKHGLSIDESIRKVLEIKDPNKRIESLRAAKENAWKSMHEKTPNLRLTGGTTDEENPMWEVK